MNIQITEVVGGHGHDDICNIGVLLEGAVLLNAGQACTLDELYDPTQVGDKVAMALVMVHDIVMTITWRGQRMVLTNKHVALCGLDGGWTAYLHNNFEG